VQKKTVADNKIAIPPGYAVSPQEFKATGEITGLIERADGTSEVVFTIEKIMERGAALTRPVGTGARITVIIQQESMIRFKVHDHAELIIAERLQLNSENSQFILKYAVIK